MADGESRNSSGSARPNADFDAIAYGLTTKGNGDVILTEERHMSLSVGGAGWAGIPVHIHKDVIGVDLYNQTTTGGWQRH